MEEEEVKKFVTHYLGLINAAKARDRAMQRYKPEVPSDQGWQQPAVEDMTGLGALTDARLRAAQQRLHVQRQEVRKLQNEFAAVSWDWRKPRFDSGLCLTHRPHSSPPNSMTTTEMAPRE